MICESFGGHSFQRDDPSKDLTAMLVRANELRVEHARIVSVVFKDEWLLFYEPNVSNPVIKKATRYSQLEILQSLKCAHFYIKEIPPFNGWAYVSGSIRNAIEYLESKK